MEEPSGKTGYSVLQAGYAAQSANCFRYLDGIDERNSRGVAAGLSWTTESLDLSVHDRQAVDYR